MPNRIQMLDALGRGIVRAIRPIKEVLPPKGDFAYFRGTSDGLKMLWGEFVRNVRDPQVRFNRIFTHGLLPAATNFIISTNRSLSGDDCLEAGEAAKRALTLGTLNYLGGLWLPKAKPGRMNWVRGELAYGLLFPVSDLFGSLSKKYLLENDQNRDSLPREIACYSLLVGSTLALIHGFYGKLPAGNPGKKFLYSSIIGLALCAQSAYFAKKQTEHSGNPHFDIGRFTNLQFGSAAASLITLSLFPPGASAALYTRPTVAMSSYVTFGQIPFRGFALTHFYSKLNDYNWVHSQSLNGLRLILAGAIFPTNMLLLHSIKNGILWLFFGAALLGTFFNSLYWDLLDQSTGFRSLAGKGHWQKGQVPKLLDEVATAPSPRRCANLHRQMLQDMGSFALWRMQRMPDRIDFQPEQSFLPNRNFSSMENWMGSLPSDVTAPHRGLLNCRDELEEEVRSEGTAGKRQLHEYLEPAYAVADRRLKREPKIR